MKGSYIFFVYTHEPRRKICGPMSFPDEKARTTPKVSEWTAMIAAMKIERKCCEP